MGVNARGAATVVLADDNAPILELVALVLARVAGRVIPVRDGLAALDAIRKHRPDVAVLDADMPLLDGLELTRRLRRDTTLAATGVILMTAHSDAGEAAQTAGVDHFIPKPFAPSDLVTAVRDLLNRRSADTSTPTGYPPLSPRPHAPAPP
jgi:DNA-binding response OmpR family regulator